ncbi:Os01g0110050, partial [Oryza sativa Japonica Group]
LTGAGGGGRRRNGGVVAGGGAVVAGERRRRPRLEVEEYVHLLPEGVTSVEELLLLGLVEVVHLVQLRVQPREELPRRRRRRRLHLRRHLRLHDQHYWSQRRPPGACATGACSETNYNLMAPQLIAAADDDHEVLRW